MSASPKISCLTVTQNRRGPDGRPDLRLLRDAIHGYVGQTYEPREMVIVADGDDEFRRALEQELAAWQGHDLRLCWHEPAGRPLGALRNFALAEARGMVFCQWDDDDLYHPERLARQWAQLQTSGATACLLTDQLQFFTSTRELFWNDWRRAARDVSWSLIPGTLMMWKAAALEYPEDGEKARRGEDTFFLRQLIAAREVVPLSGEGYLSIYRYHGCNTFDLAHHRSLLRGVLPAKELAARRQLLETALAKFPFAGEIQVRDAQGLAFVWQAGGQDVAA